MKEIKYDIHDRLLNDFLRMALCKAWGNRCSFCGDMIHSISRAQIDHIIPQSIYRNEVELDKIRDEFEGRDYLIPDDVNSVENLAPIHEYCNKDKGNSVPRSLAYGRVLEKAKKFSSKVVKDVETARSLSRIRDVLIGVDRLDYDNSNVQNDMRYYFSVLEEVIREKHPDAVDIFSTTLDMSTYVEADNCSMPPVSYALQDRKLRLDYESCRNFLSLLYCYDLSIESFVDGLKSSLDRVLTEYIEESIISEAVDKDISSSPSIDPDFRFDLLLNSFSLEFGYFEIDGFLSGSGETMIIVPEYPSDDEGYVRQADFRFECNFEFLLPSIEDGNFSKKLPDLCDIDPDIMPTLFDLDFW
jgi:hypothetical protein